VDEWFVRLGTLAKVYDSTMAATSDRIHNLLVKLETLSQIKKGDKLAVTDGKFHLQEPGMVTSTLRSWGLDSRSATIQTVKDTTDTARTELQACENRKHEDITHAVLLKALSKACKGILTLRETYKGDRQIISEVNVLVGNIISDLRKHGAIEDNLPLVEEDEEKEEEEVVEESAKAIEESRERRESVVIGKSKKED